MDQIEKFVSEVDLPEHVRMSESDTMVELRSDEFGEIPRAGESPDVIYVSKTQSGQLDVRPVGGAERMEVTASAAIDYLEELFF